MAEEEKERGKNEDQEEQDPLADLLVEGEEEGSDTTEESKEFEESSEKSSGREEKGEEEPPEDFEDPLASILGDEEPLEESQQEDSKSDEKEEKSSEEQEDEKEEKSPSQGKLAVLFWILAILVPLVLGGAGVFTLLQLMKQPEAIPPKIETKAISKEGTPEKKEQKIKAPVIASPIAVEERKLLFLKDFLIPYRRETGEYVFVKAKVMLYYAKEADFWRAQKNKALLREELYRLFRNVPLYLWEDPKGAKVIEREFMDYLTKKKIGDVVPTEIKISGYVLK